MGGARGRLGITLLFGLALACGYQLHDDQSSDGCPAGSAGCPCAEDGGCEGALERVDAACQPGPGGSTTTFCDLDDGDADCQGLSVDGLVCVPYHEPGNAPPGLENVGVCGRFRETWLDPSALN